MVVQMPGKLHQVLRGLAYRNRRSLNSEIVVALSLFAGIDDVGAEVERWGPPGQPEPPGEKTTGEDEGHEKREGAA